MPIQTSWSSILEDLEARRNISREQSSWALSEIMTGNAPENEVSSFMLALRAKGETVEELAGLVDTMLQNALKLETGNNAVDIVGTGGDMIGTVNISSMASILTAASGVPVLKHGSRSASGKTGSSEMLQELGINLIYGGHYATETSGVKALAQALEEQFHIPWHFSDHPTGL
jgi:anthranilate phosphoribosyltransferase